jgi:ABC-2 type transport system permease protein
MNKQIHSEQLIQLITAHFKELIRQPEVIFWGFFFPMLMSLGLGVAFTQKTDIVRNVAVVEKKQDASHSTDNSSAIDNFLISHTKKGDSSEKNPASYRLTLSDDRLGNTTFILSKTDWDHALLLLKRGNISVIMVGRNDRIEYHFDPLNPEAQLTYLKLSNIFNGKEIISNKSSNDIEPLTVSGTRYIDFLIPGLISMDLTMSIMWGLSYGMIERRSRKLLRRMVATPMKKSYFLLALMFVRVSMNFIESALLVIFAYLVFDVRIQGSLLALCAIFIAGNIAFAGIAIFTSSHTASTETGNGLMNAIVLPMTVLSGIFFSYHNFPKWSIPFIQKLPLTMLADGIRSVFIEGAGCAQIAFPSLVLMTIGIVFFSAGLKIFKWY